MDTQFALDFLFVAAAIFAADVCWTLYFIETTAKNAVKAAFWSSMIMVCSAFAVTGYVEDKRLIVAAIVGAFLGTYATIKWKNKRGEV
jgi:hypothetical protein